MNEVQNTIAQPVEEGAAVAQAAAVPLQKAAADIARYKELRGRIEDLEAQAASVRAEIAAALGDAGLDSLQCSAGRAYFTKAAVSVSYDAKALDALLASDDAFARLLRPHRKETQRSPLLTIR